MTILNKKHLFYYRLLQPLVCVFDRLYLGYTWERPKKADLPDNYLVLSNHTSDFDPVLVGASFPRQMYFVGSEHIARWKLAYAFLKHCFAPIMRPKGASAAATLMDMVRYLKKGSNVCLFAEGVRSWDGRTSNIVPATAKLVKAAGCGLITYRIEGGYFASPMWSGASVRRGHWHGAPVHIYTKEDLEAMSPQEIYSAILNDLSEDAYSRQLTAPKRYRGKRLAEGLEHLLFLCPCCGGRDTFTSQDDTVTCGTCGMTYRYTEYGMLELTKAGQGATEATPTFTTVQAFSDWQKSRLPEDAAADFAYTAPHATLTTVKDHQEQPVTEGPVSLSSEGLRCGDHIFPLDTIQDLAMRGQRAILFTANKTYYELIPDTGTNAYKFHLYYNALRDQLKESTKVNELSSGKRRTRETDHTDPHHRRLDSAGQLTPAKEQVHL